MRTLAKLILFMVICVNLTCVVFARDHVSTEKSFDVISAMRTEYAYPIEPIMPFDISDYILPEGIGPIEDEILDVEPIIEESALILSSEEIELIALVTMAEAEGECEEGKRLVIDTILNRVDSEHFPDTVYDVVYQPSQFSSMWNGRVDRCYAMEEIVHLIIEEMTHRTNNQVMFFTAGGYSNYGTPLMQVEHHYFSSYN